MRYFSSCFHIFFLLIVNVASSRPVAPFSAIFPASATRAATPPLVKRTLDCPPNTVLEGKTCVKREVLPADQICPTGTHIVGNQCATFSRALRVCPEEYSLTIDEKCIHSEITSVDYICEEGQLEYNACRIQTDTSPLCPFGFQRHDNVCLKYSPQETSCPPGFYLFHEQCTRNVSESASKSCPPEYTLTADDQCTRSIPVPPHCIIGYTQNENGECIREITHIPGPCEPGFTPTSLEICAQKHVFKPQKQCPDGFIMDENDYCIEEIPLVPECPLGSFRGGSGECERTIPKIPVCGDPDAKRIGNECITISRFKPDLQCSDGYYLIHDKCKNVEKTTPIDQCSTGVLEGDQCVVKVESNPLLKCPEGYKVAKGPKCQREITYDCPKTIVKTECDMPDFVAEIGGKQRSQTNKHHLQQDAIGVKYYKKNHFLSLSTNKGKSEKNESKSPDCSNVKETVPGTCVRVEEEHIEYICADGSKPVGKTCFIITVAPKNQYCSSGQLDKSFKQCVRIKVQPPTKVCSTGALTKDEKCSVIDKNPVLMVCPEGSVESESKLGTCVIFEQEIKLPNIVLYQAPNEVCDGGCVKIEEVPRAKVCPPESEDRNGQCIVTSSLIIPEPVVLNRKSDLECPNGTVLEGNNCIHQESIPSLHFCRNNGILEGEQCVHSAELIQQPPKISIVSAKPVCPNGYQLHNQHQCILSVTHPADIICQQGIKYEDGFKECIRYHDRIQICPTGTERLKNGCIKTSYSPPRVIEVKVCTKGEPGC